MRGPLTPSSRTLLGWHNSGPYGVSCYLGQADPHSPSSPAIPSASGGSGRARTPLAKWGGRKGSRLPLFRGTLAGLGSGAGTAGPGRVRPEEGVGLVSVLPVVSVTCGTSQTYLLIAGPEELVEGPGQLEFPESSPWGLGGGVGGAWSTGSGRGGLDV